MIALTLLLLTALALIQTATLAMSVNVINALREEAVSVAEQRMGDLRNAPFTSTVTDPLLIQTGASGVPDTPPTISRVIRNYGNFPFTVTRTVTDVNTNCKQVMLKIDWSYRGKAYTHGLATVVSKK